jgi:hypothetical protein
LTNLIILLFMKKDNFGAFLLFRHFVQDL